MINFTYHIPTDICFGQGQLASLGARIAELGRHVLLVYGGGSIRRTGLYDAVMAQLAQAGAEVTELGGVEPNPRITSVRKGVALCHEHGVEVVLAVGGGSAIDCAKMVAAGACYDGDTWELVTDPSRIQKTLPVACVVTIAATGSEMDEFAVISDMEKNEKRGTASDKLRPVFSILDPTYTYTVSAYQTAAGTADIMSHVFESYFNQVPGAYVQARLAEGILKTCIHYGPIALKEPENYEARANLMWSASLAINGLLRYGENAAWSVHAMEHELSAYYDLTHGAGLAILTPYWMQYVLSEKTMHKFVEYGVNVWGLDPSLPEREIAETAIAKTRTFFDTLGLPTHLSDVQIDDAHFEQMARKAAAGGLAYGFVPLQAEDVLRIFRSAL